MSKKVRLPAAKQERSTRLLSGGPWNNKFVSIPIHGTMHFRISGWFGYYDYNGRWVEVVTAKPPRP